MRQNHWPNYSPKEKRQLTRAEQVAQVVGSEDSKEVERALEHLDGLLKVVPKSGRSLTAFGREEFVIPVASAAQKDALLEALFDLGIFPWEEDGQLIVDHKKDLTKLELARIYTPPTKVEAPTLNQDGGAVMPNDIQSIPFPTLPQDPGVIDTNRKIGRALKVQQGIKPETIGSNEEIEEEGIDTEIRDLINKFDQGLIDSDDEDFVHHFGYMPTLTLFPHKYIWRQGLVFEARSGKEITKEQQESLLQKAKEGDVSAMDTLVRMKVGLVLMTLERVRQKLGGDPDDLFQEGLIGLVRAIETHDPSKASLTTHAVITVDGRMRQFIGDSKGSIRLPSSAREKATMIRKESSRTAGEAGTVNPEVFFENNPKIRASRGDGSYKKISPDGVGLDRLERLYLINAIFDPISHGDGNVIDAESEKQPTDLELENNPTTAPVIRQEMLTQLNVVLNSLTPREERIIRMRFGLSRDNEMSLEETAEEFHVTHGRVRQIEAKALRKLKHPSRSRKLVWYRN